MAFSNTIVLTNVNGNLKEKYFDLDFASVTSGHIKSGFGTVVFAEHLNNTTENDGKLKINVASDGTTVEFGSVYFSSFTSNDTARVKITGY
jgi:hypothetical protein